MKMNEKRKGPTLGVHFRGGVSITESKKTTEEREGPAPGVHFRKVSAF